MQIILNGHEHDTVAPLTRAQLLEPVGYANRRVGAEINRGVVSHSQPAERVRKAAIVSRSCMRPALAEPRLHREDWMICHIEAGRAAFRAGRVPRKRYGSASGPLERTI